MRTLWTPLIPAAMLALMTLLPASAAAQESGGSIDLQLFRPAMDSKGYITLNSSQPLGHLDLSFGLVTTYARSPISFVKDTPGGNYWCDSPMSASKPTCTASSTDRTQSKYHVENLFTANLQAAIGLFKHFEVGLGLPLTLWNGDTDPSPYNDGSDDGSFDGAGRGRPGPAPQGPHPQHLQAPGGPRPGRLGLLPHRRREQFLGTGRFAIAPSVIVDKEFFDGRLQPGRQRGRAHPLRHGHQGWTRQPRSARHWAHQRQDHADDLRHGDAPWRPAQHLYYGVGAAFAIVPQRLSLSWPRSSGRPASTACSTLTSSTRPTRSWPA